MNLQNFIDQEVARKNGFFNEIKRDEAIDLFSQLTKQLGFTVEITHDDGDMVSFKLTTRFSLSRSELREVSRQSRDDVHGADREVERPRPREKDDKKKDKPKNGH